MFSCFEYFACGQLDCNKYNINNKNCWEIEGTDGCRAHTEAMEWLREECGNNLEACKFCLYYKYRCEYEQKEVVLNNNANNIKFIPKSGLF